MIFLHEAPSYYIRSSQQIRSFHRLFAAAINSRNDHGMASPDHFHECNLAYRRSFPQKISRSPAQARTPNKQIAFLNYILYTYIIATA